MRRGIAGPGVSRSEGALILNDYAMQPIVSRWARAAAPFTEVFIGVAVLGSTWAAILFTRLPGGIAFFWPGAVIPAALLIRTPAVRWGRAAAAVFSALVLVNMLAAHRSVPISMLLAGTNGLEIALSVAAFRFAWVFPYPNITINQAAIMTAVLGIAVPGIVAPVAGLILQSCYGTPFLVGTLHWWSAHTIGACLLGPPLILCSVNGFTRLVRGRFGVENALTALGCLIGCYLAIRYVRFPFVVLGLLLTVAAFRQGGFGASLMSLAFGILISLLWMSGVRPLGLDPVTATNDMLAGLPVVALLATVIPPIAVGLGSDARRAAARALRASERRFRESMEHSPIGMLISDLEGVWGYTNVALQTMLGYSAEEFQAMPSGGPSKSDDWKESESRWRPLLSGEIRAYNTVRSFQHKDGHWVWTHVAVSLLRDADGKPSNLIAQIESLQARHEAAQMLADERERLKTTLASISDAVVTTDAGTRITYINAAAESLLGFKLQAVEGRRVDEVIYLMEPGSSKAAANLIAQSALHGKVVRREQSCLLHRPDGSIYDVTDVVSPVFDTSGTLRSLVIVFHDATLEVDRARDLNHRALHDPLTGLSNRADFEQRLGVVFRNARHTERPAALMAIDLDRFKAVNDAAGHAAGDAMLCRVAEVCRATVRSSDVVARLGGDEFAVLLDNCSEDRASRIGQQLLEALSDLSLAWEGARYTIGASIGLSMVHGSDMQDVKDWLKAADQACYRAKREGRGRLQVGARLAEVVPLVRKG